MASRPRMVAILASFWIDGWCRRQIVLAVEMTACVRVAGFQESRICHGGVAFSLHVLLAAQRSRGVRPPAAEPVARGAPDRKEHGSAAADHEPPRYLCGACPQSAT